jgi:DNA-directed RNA polymerase specialized sigma24 family protein
MDREAHPSLADDAFATLPERWRIVLWHLDVMNEPSTQVAPLLGMTPGGVETLAHRAREGLRKAYLQRVPCGRRSDSTRS